MTYNEYLAGMTELSKNEWYWLIDGDYSGLYKMLFDYKDSTSETRKYLVDVMKFMLHASKRIFG